MTELDKLNVHTPDELTRWLGVKMVHDPFDPQNMVVAVRQRDPKCRFVYIYGANSRARLGITRSMLLELFTFHQVMPDYLDFISVFGLQSETQDLIRFSSFREQKTLKINNASTGTQNMGRSGRNYQLCYNLKGASLKFQDPDNESKNQWSIRQAAFYHQLDVVGGNAVWIVTKGGLDIQQRFKELTGKDARPEDKAFGNPDECFRSSLSAHLLFCHWSTEDWRGYIKWLEYTIEDDVSQIFSYYQIFSGRIIANVTFEDGDGCFGPDWERKPSSHLHNQRCTASSTMGREGARGHFRAQVEYRSHDLYPSFLHRSSRKRGLPNVEVMWR